MRTASRPMTRATARSTASIPSPRQASSTIKPSSKRKMRIRSSSPFRRTKKELLIRIRRSFRKTGKMQPIRSRTQATSSPAAPSMLQKAHGLKTMISKRSSYRMLSSADTISTITPAPTSTATAWPPTSAS